MVIEKIEVLEFPYHLKNNFEKSSGKKTRAGINIPL
jgi:hypothetical protein